MCFLYHLIVRSTCTLRMSVSYTPIQLLLLGKCAQLIYNWQRGLTHNKRDGNPQWTFPWIWWQDWTVYIKQLKQIFIDIRLWLTVKCVRHIDSCPKPSWGDHLHTNCWTDQKPQPSDLCVCQQDESVAVASFVTQLSEHCDSLKSMCLVCGMVMMSDCSFDSSARRTSYSPKHLSSAWSMTLQKTAE